MTKIASRALGWPEHVPFTSSPTTGSESGLAGWQWRRGSGWAKEWALELPLSDGVGLGVMAVPGEPHPLSAKTAASAPTENLTPGMERGHAALRYRAPPNMSSVSDVIAAAQDTREPGLKGL